MRFIKHRQPPRNPRDRDPWLPLGARYVGSLGDVDVYATERDGEPAITVCHGWGADTVRVSRLFDEKDPTPIAGDGDGNGSEPHGPNALTPFVIDPGSYENKGRKRYRSRVTWDDVRRVWRRRWRRAAR